MSKILQMKMNNNRYYYKQGQSSKVPYLLVLIIFVLLYIMNGLHEDSKDANSMVKEVLSELPKCDSISKIHKKEVDSLISVIDWYKNQEEEQRKIKRPTTPIIKKKTEATSNIVTDSLK